MDAVLSDRVGLLCDQLSRFPSLQEFVAKAGVAAKLDELLALVADPREPDPARVRELLDAIDVACTVAGLAGLTSRTKGGVPAGLRLPPDHSEAEGPMGWTCPLERCDRVVLRQDSAERPSCAAREALMTPFYSAPR